MKHPALRLPALAAAALLAACSSMAPPYQRPEAPVAAQFADAPPATAIAASTGAPDLPWQDYFADPQLRTLITLALQNNRDLRVALLNVEQAREQLNLRNADRWPTVGVGVSGNRTATPDGGSSEVYSAGLQVSAYELDLFGRLRSLNDVAAAQLLASDEARKAAQISLVATVAGAWLALRADEAALQVTQQTLGSREESLRLTALRLQYGAASRLDQRLAESVLESARVALAQQKRQRALDRNALELLLGQPLPAELATAVTALGSEPLLWPELPVGLPSDVLARRPDVRQAEQLLIGANANIGAAKAALFPRISLTASAGSVSSELSGLFAGGSWGIGLAPTLLQTIFDAGRNRANVRSAEQGQRIAVAQYEKTVQSAFREVADALAGRGTLSEQQRAQQAQVAAEADRLALTELRQRSGAAGSLEVLDAQRSLFSARLALVQVQAAQAQNAVALYRALGGGWADASPR